MVVNPLTRPFLICVSHGRKIQQYSKLYILKGGKVLYGQLKISYFITTI